MLRYMERERLTEHLTKILPEIEQEVDTYEDCIVELVREAVSTHNIHLMRAATAAVCARTNGQCCHTSKAKWREKFIPLSVAAGTEGANKSNIRVALVGIRRGLFAMNTNPQVRLVNHGDGKWRVQGVEGLVTLPGAEERLEKALKAWPSSSCSCGSAS